jgi:hypothetical protein
MLRAPFRMISPGKNNPALGRAQGRQRNKPANAAKAKRDAGFSRGLD